MIQILRVIISRCYTYVQHKFISLDRDKNIFKKVKDCAVIVWVGLQQTIAIINVIVC